MRKGHGHEGLRLARADAHHRAAQAAPARGGGSAIERPPPASLLAVNVVIKGLLSEGVSSSTRSDPQAKALGECLRAGVVEIPEALRG